MSAFPAQYVSFKYLKTANEYEIQLRIPRHKWSEVYDLIGDPPDAGESKWIGCAPMKEPPQ